LNFGLLALNLELNGVGNVHAFPFALDDAAGMTDFFRSRTNFGDFRTAAPADNEAGFSVSKIRLPKVAAADYIRNALGDQAPKQLDLIKIDTQGAEFGVLRGCRPLIGPGTKLSMEFSPYHLARNGMALGDVEKAFGGATSIAKIVWNGSHLVHAAVGVAELVNYFASNSLPDSPCLDLVIQW
jgi:FkbM family methyltransferase